MFSPDRWVAKAGLKDERLAITDWKRPTGHPSGVTMPLAMVATAAKPLKRFMAVVLPPEQTGWRGEKALIAPRGDGA